jgi:hypothetical protein
MTIDANQARWWRVGYYFQTAIRQLLFRMSITSSTVTISRHLVPSLPPAALTAHQSSERATISGLACNAAFAV